MMMIEKIKEKIIRESMKNGKQEEYIRETGYRAELKKAKKVINSKDEEIRNLKKINEKLREKIGKLKKGA